VLLVIVDDLHVVGVAVSPAKADPPSIIDANAVLPCSISSQALQPVAGRYAKILEARGGVQDAELPKTHSLHVFPEPPDRLPVEQALRVTVAEALDHAVA
jgi:hypothetical protein